MAKRKMIILFSCLLNFVSFAQQGYNQYVNPFIGTGGHGHTYPGATVPHGMVQLSPDTRLKGWDGCSGYHYSDSFIYGFSHTHLSGTGVSDYGDILLMPMNGKPSADNKIYGSAFKHSNEQASPGYYNVMLDDDGIGAEFTCSERVGFHHYAFSSTLQNNLILDLVHRDEVIESYMTIEDSVTVTGLRRSRSWADNQYVYFVIRFSKPIMKSGIWQDTLLKENLKHAVSNKLKAYFRFDLANSKDVYVKVALSPVSIDGARENMEEEIPGWDFAVVKSNAEQKWEMELSKIDVKSNDPAQLKIFYTALYHTAVVPNINMDVDGSYRGMDDKIHVAEGFTYYSVFSLWDTYRAAHPLYTIIDRKRTLDYIKTFLVQYQQGGRLPVWELASCETNCMIGYHSIPVIVDAFTKGINEFDTKLALEAMKKSAESGERGLADYMTKGLIETDDELESVSKTLEYAYDDWCISIFAKMTGNNADYEKYLNRSQYYKNLYDKKSGFMRPVKNGGWLLPFDPREVNNNFTEANSWQYSFYFPQDISGYLKLSGGPGKLEEKLDQLFVAPSATTGRNQSDITGLIGQYAHGNEPSHHIIYLYDYTAHPFKSQELLHQVMKEMYRNAPDGLIGNEDCGQMSAWYVMSALGFYPVTPGSLNYMIGTPAFSLATINLENGKTFIINAAGLSDQNYFIQNILLSTTRSLRPKNWDSIYLKHEDIANGGLVTFMMGDHPSSSYAHYPGMNKAITKPVSDFVLNPLINGGGIPFRGVKQVSISSRNDPADIYYTTDGSVPTEKSYRYSSPLKIDRSEVVKAIAINKKRVKSFVTTAVYKKIPNNWSVQYNTKYEDEYDGGGNDALIDGIRGSVNWQKGNWQGYQRTDLDVMIDLKVVKKISRITAGFLQDTRSWIVMPKQVIIETSTDGKNFAPLYKGENFLYIENMEPQIMDIEPSFPSREARYVRLKGIQYGKLPEWHPGAGSYTHIFVDEIQID